MSTSTKRDAINGAMSLADDVAQGRLDPTELEATAVAECRALFGTVAGPDDPLWDLQVQIARQVLGLDGIPADELSEWLAVARQRAGQPVSPADASPDAVSAASEAYSVASDAAVADDTEPVAAALADAEPAVIADEPGSEPQPLAEVRDLSQRPATSSVYDPLAGWQPGR